MLKLKNLKFTSPNILSFFSHSKIKTQKALQYNREKSWPFFIFVLHSCKFIVQQKKSINVNTFLGKIQNQYVYTHKRARGTVHPLNSVTDCWRYLLLSEEIIICVKIIYVHFLLSKTCLEHSVYSREVS